MTNFYVAAHGLIKNDGKYLVTRRSEKNDYLPLTWDVPGGTADAGETIEIALDREIQEETGLKVSVLSPIHIYTNLSQLPQKQTFQIVFECEYQEGTITLNPEEHDQYKWIEKSEFIDLKLIPFVASLVEADSFKLVS